MVKYNLLQIVSFQLTIYFFIPPITTMTDPFAIKVYSIRSHDLENLLCHFFDD